MKGGKWLFLVIPVAFLGCAGGGVQSGSTAGGIDSQKFASDALVQFLPYELLRNNLIQALCLGSTSNAIEELDDNKILFGGPDENNPGSERKLGFSLTRLRKHTAICDLGCQDGLKNCPTKLFPDPANSLDPSVIGRRILGIPITDGDREGVTALMNKTGFTSVSQRQHAICMAFCNSLKGQVQ